MTHRFLAVVALAACSGPSKPVEDPRTTPPPDATPAPPTEAERALEAHRDALLAQRGVVDARVDGDRLVVDVCAPEVPVDLSGIDVPVSPVAAWRDGCGCVEAETYYDDGAVIPRACNACTCEGGAFACTAQICELQERVPFTRNAAELSKRTRAQLDAVAQRLIASPDVRVTLRGHADAMEVSLTKLSRKRARAVRDYLLAAGVPKAQLLGIEAVGADQPLGQGAEADRTVEFLVAD